MALVVVLRGINVGGHRRFRPTLLAQALAELDVVNIGAAGTFVVRKPGARSRLRATLRAYLPATTDFVCCEARELLGLEAQGVFADPAPDRDVVRFVSFLAKAPRVRPPLPFTIPAGRDWFVRVTSQAGHLAVGEYRRHMKTIGYLGQLDAVFGTRTTTRSWSTVAAVMQVLRAGSDAPRRHRARSPRRNAIGRPGEG